MKPEIVELYKKILTSGYYDEEFAGKQQEINGKTHGVCIDFSRNLIKELREAGYGAALISTQKDKNSFLHAAVMYKNEESGEILIADPVVDIRRLTSGEVKEIDEILKEKNYMIDMYKYIKENGAITDYDDSKYEKDGKSSPRILRENMKDKYEIMANPNIVNLVKQREEIQELTRLEDVSKVADGASLLACQLLYEKGIDTYCSNFCQEDDRYVDMALNYNQLSKENKEILKQLLEDKPDNYKIFNKKDIFGYPSLDNKSKKDFSQDEPMTICLGFKNINPEESTESINLRMAELVKPFKKQEYKEGVYSKEEIMSNKHNIMRCNYINKEAKECESTDQDSNEQIAEKEGLLYSEEYNLFFESEANMSRYIESLFRKENDWRTTEEIAKDAGIPYDGQKLSDKYEINSDDLAKASKVHKIGGQVINKVKELFKRLRGRTKGER